MIDFNKNWINENVIEYKFVRDGHKNFTFDNFLAISENQDVSFNFINAMSRALRNSQEILKSYFWECPPIRQDTIRNQLQFVTVKAPESSLKQDYSCFEQHFLSNKNKLVCSFLNLGGDAIIVAPIPKSGKDFAYLANFNENADFNTKRKFWEKVAEELSKFYFNPPFFQNFYTY